jgi:formylmethanofuran dehydrogenase subunit C
MLKLRYKGTSLIPVEAECLTPDALAGKSVTEIAKLPLQHGNARVPLAELFDVSGPADDGELAIEGDCSRVKWIGARMTRGRLTVDGDAGMHLGAEMAGGEIHLRGNAAEWLGAQMRGGLIHIDGSAADHAGGAYPGSRAGMRGGVLLIEGNAGREAGNTMRRGLIAVGKDCGQFAGASLVAGSIFIFGAARERVGAGMKRGTIALFGAMPPLLPSFRFDCLYRPAFLDLYLTRLRGWRFPVPPELERGFYSRYSGDLLELGKGELLHWQPAGR